MPSRRSPDETAGENAILTWRYPDGTVASGHPLSRKQAEHLARIYGTMYPDQTYWLEPMRIEETRSYMRVRRRRVVAPRRDSE
jgi:hypothetical protein